MNEEKLREITLSTMATVLYQKTINGGHYLWDGMAVFYEPTLDTIFSGSAAEVDLLDASEGTFVVVDREEWEEFMPRTFSDVPGAVRKLTELVVPLLREAIKEHQLLKAAKQETKK
jgi:hypothetical protein